LDPNLLQRKLRNL